jgi:hypothetical protein
LHVHDEVEPEVVHVWFVPQVLVLTHAVHPLPCVSHVWTPPPAHCVAPLVHALVQHEAVPAGPEQSPPEHVWEFDWYRQLFVSSVHVRSVELFEQSVPAAVHPGARSQVHAPDPADPVQDWCVPQVCVPVTLRHPLPSAVHVARVVPLSQTLPAVLLQLGSLLHVHDAEPAAPVHTWSAAHPTAVPYSSQPSACNAQVWMVPDVAHCICPTVQTLEHVAEHAAVPPSTVAHDGVGFVQGVLDWTKRQWLESVAHSSSVEPLHVAPFAVQTLPLQVHDDVVPEVVHVWFVPHVLVLTQFVHPFDCVWHVCTPASEHSVAAPPSWRFEHAFVQHDAAPASPAQSPFEHVCELCW